MTDNKKKIKLLEKILKKYKKELDAAVYEKQYLEQKIVALDGIVKKITEDIAELSD
jgi:hypothetical protein